MPSNPFGGIENLLGKHFHRLVVRGPVSHGARVTREEILEGFVGITRYQVTEALPHAWPVHVRFADRLVILDRDIEPRVHRFTFLVRKAPSPLVDERFKRVPASAPF